MNIKYVHAKGPRFVLPCILLVMASLSAFGQGPVIPFQGQLTDQAGTTALSPAAPLTLVFRMYDQPVNGTAFWTEPQSNVVVIGGRFNVLLGSVSDLTPYLSKFNATVYLGITIDDGNKATADVELRPRQAIVPVISASHAGNADKLAGHDWADILEGGSNDPSGAQIRGDKVSKVANAEHADSADHALSADNATNAGYANTAGNGGPVGTILPFYDCGGKLPVPDGWQKCDGGAVADASSPLIAAGVTNVPNLTDGRYLRGTVTSGSLDGSDSTGIRDGGTDLNTHQHETPLMSWGGYAQKVPYSTVPFGLGGSGTMDFCVGTSPQSIRTLQYLLTNAPYQTDLNAHTHSLNPKHFDVIYIIRIR